MAGAWITRAKTPKGEPRYRVRYRVGGRESATLYAGSFRTMRDAKARRDWIAGELSARRLPDLAPLAPPRPPPTVAETARRWQDSRIDVAQSTRVLHRVALGRVLPLIGEIPAESLTPADVAEAVSAMHAAEYARGSIEKSLAALRQALDHADIDPNPARDRRVKLPPKDHAEVAPPTANQFEAALGYVARRYRLPLLLLEATAMRVGELEHLRWADVDEQSGQFRLSAASTKTRRARMVHVPADLFGRVLALTPREDRDPDGLVFPDATQARMRTDLGRACKAAGVARFGLHDLRHRRCSLWLHAGVPVHMIAAAAGHARSSMTLDVYSHVLVGEREIDRQSVPL